MRPLAALLVLAACGDNIKPPAPDAPGATTQDVTVTTYVRNGDPAPEGTLQNNVHVLVVQPDGTRGEDVMTDAMGNATLHGVLPGAAITAAYPEVAFPQNSFFEAKVTSFLDVMPGDHLVFGDRYDPTPFDPNMVGSMTVDVPLFPGAAAYDVTTACGENDQSMTTSVDVYLEQTCANTTGPLLAWALDSNGLNLATSYSPAAMLAPRTTADMPAWTPSAQVTASIVGMLPDLHDFTLDITAVYTAALVSDPAGLAAPGGPSAATFMQQMPMTAPRYIGHAKLERNPYGEQDTYRAVAGPATAISLAEPVLPWVNVLVADPSTGQASWFATDASYKAAVLTISWASFGGADVHGHTWTVILPPGTTTLDFNPALATAVPALSDSFGPASVVLVDMPTLPNYDAVRALPEWEIANPAAAVDAGDLPAVDTATALMTVL